MIYKLTSKVCSSCKEEKEISFFGKDSSNKTGLTRQCKECNRKRVNAYNKANPEKKREQNYKARYGVTIKEHNALYKKQDGKCATCNDELNPGVIDHNHITGEIRGLLCNSCNSALGFAKDNIQTLSNMIEYIQWPCSSAGE